MVERITDVSGAAAETQKSFGLLMLCIGSKFEHFSTTYTVKINIAVKYVF